MKKLYALVASLLISVSAFATPSSFTYGVGAVKDSITHEKSTAHTIKANISLTDNVDFSIFNRTQSFNDNTSATVVEFVPNYYVGDFSVGVGLGRDLTDNINYNIVTGNYAKPINASGTVGFIGGQVNYKPDVRNHKISWIGVAQPMTEKVYLNFMVIRNTGTFNEKELNVSVSVFY